MISSIWAVDAFLAGFPYPHWLVVASVIITNLGMVPMALTIGYALFVHTADHRIVAVMVALLILNAGLKAGIGRPRPDNPFISNNHSFPSNHSAFSMIVALYIYKHFRKKWIFIYPITIGLTRIFMKVHYLSDVLGGFLISWLVFMIFEQWSIPSSRRQA